MFQVSRGFKFGSWIWILFELWGGGGFESTEFQLAGFYCTTKHHVIQEQHDF